ncbi:uncharacterized protein LOC114968218 [Acropora millepora]|uniref:uncharacterized protein LOC114968218 n=1 Tax=Acropora millepora TaxID=45264 RepID=UPI001CF3850B|nr:uncharacterized protein LOC114968218 [Acropora millepora]
MAQQQLRKRRLEEKLGLNQEQTIKSGFDQETIDIVWDIMNKKCDLRDHPLIKDNEQSEPSWVFFLVVYDLHAAIWAVEEKYMQNLDVLAQEYLTPYDSGECLKASSLIRRFHVVLREDDHFYVVADDLYLHGKEPQFDICLYVGTLTLSFRALKVIMATIADKNYLLLQSDCLEYCKQFVYIYFDLIEEEISKEQTAVLEKLTVTTNALFASSERSGRQNRSSGFSLRTFLTSRFAQVYLATLLAGLTLFGAYKFHTRRL